MDPTVKIKVRLDGLRKKLSDVDIRVGEGFRLNTVRSEFLRILDTEKLTHSDRSEITAKIMNIFDHAQIEFHENYTDRQIEETIENQPFIADSNNLNFKLLQTESSTLIVENQGIKVIELSFEKSYLMIIKARSLIKQRKDLLFPLIPPITESSPFEYNIYLEQQKGKDNLRHSSYKWSLLEHIPTLSKLQKLEALIDESYVEVHYESFLLGILKKKLAVALEPGQEEPVFPFMNYMVFRVSNLQIAESPDKAVPFSFDAVLTSSGESEKTRLKSCIEMVHLLQENTDTYFLAPFLNVCQSSGSGKSKIAAELMLDVPSCFVVLREEESTARGYPENSDLSYLFMSISTTLDDDPNLISDLAHLSVVGMYLLLIKAILSDFLDTFTRLLMEGNLKSALNGIYGLFLDRSFFGDDLKKFQATNDWNGIYIDENTRKFTNAQGLSLDISNICKSCLFLLKSISELYKNSTSGAKPFPFVLTVDEASFMSLKLSKNGVSFFRLFRRAVNFLDKSCNLVVLTLGTNSDILDLNPEMSGDSYRFNKELIRRRIFPPFILSRNWDILLDYEEMVSKPLRYDQMTCGRLMIFWMSLGRPVWSSLSFGRLMNTIQIKLCNNSVESGEAFLAFWMVRVGLLVHPAHVVTKHLVKSLMATLLYTSHDLTSMRAYYPSEPALAVAARDYLSRLPGSIDEYYNALAKFVELRAIDTGRFSEIISADVCLLAIAKAKKEECHWDFVEGLPEVCKSDSFILKNAKFHLQKTQTELDEFYGAENSSKSKSESVSLSETSLLRSNYIIVRVDQFVCSMYGEEAFNSIKHYIPETIKSYRLNTTHLTLMAIKFPFNSLNLNHFDLTEAPIAASKSSTKINEKSCSQITSETLESMLMRGSGGMLAPNSFGLDYFLPVVMKPDTADISTVTPETETVEGEESVYYSAEDEPTSGTEKADVEMITQAMEQVEVQEDANLKPEYSYIGVQVKRGKISNIRPIVAKGALSNHYVRCGLHGPKCSCEFRLSDKTFKKIVGNGLILIHSMQDVDLDSASDAEKEDLEDSEDEEYFLDAEDEEGSDENETVDGGRRKRARRSPNITFESSLPEFNDKFVELANFKRSLEARRITKQQFENHKALIDKDLKELTRALAPEVLPPELKEQISSFTFKPFVLSHYRACRFIPTFYVSIPISSSLSVHIMIKRRERVIQGVTDWTTERVTAIYSKGLEPFSNVLPEEARLTAKKVIFNEHSVLDEISSKIIQSAKILPIKYTELVSAVVARNNGSSIPIANNFIRKKYDLSPIPELMPEYNMVNKENIKNLL